MVRDLKTKYSYPIAGTLRIGEKKGNRPTSLNYFTVHEDSHTTSDVVKSFNDFFKEKPKELTIKFLTNDPLKVDYLRYTKSGLQCVGNGENASYKDKEKNEWCNCECSQECKYRDNECKLTGRLDFVIKDVNIGGLWRFQTRSNTTIDNFLRTLNFLKFMNRDITKSYFKLIVEEKMTNSGGEVRKFISLNLKEIIDKEQFIDNQEENDEIETFTDEVIETKTNTDDFEKCLSLIELHDLNIKDKVFKEALFCNMKDETEGLIIHPDILEEVSNWQIGSAIIPTKILEKNGFKTLLEYQDLGIIKKQKAE